MNQTRRLSRYWLFPCHLAQPRLYPLAHRRRLLPPKMPDRHLSP